jgi:hypothetical protein
MVVVAILSILYLAVGFYLSNVMSWPLSHSVGAVGFVVLLLSHLAAWLGC